MVCVGPWVRGLCGSNFYVSCVGGVGLNIFYVGHNFYVGYVGQIYFCVGQSFFFVWVKVDQFFYVSQHLCVS